MNWYTRHELSTLAMLATQVEVVVDRVRMGLELEDVHRAVLERAAAFLESEARVFRPEEPSIAEPARLMRSRRTAELLLEQWSHPGTLTMLSGLAQELRQFANEPTFDRAEDLYRHFHELAEMARDISRSSNRVLEEA